MTSRVASQRGPVSAFFAGRLKKEAGEEPGKQAARAFQVAFGRDPAASEREAAVELVRSHGLAALCRAIYNSNEFIYVN